MPNRAQPCPTVPPVWPKNRMAKPNLGAQPVFPFWVRLVRWLPPGARRGDKRPRCARRPGIGAGDRAGPGWNWYGFPGTFTLAGLLELFPGWLIVGAILARLVPPADA